MTLSRLSTHHLVDKDYTFSHYSQLRGRSSPFGAVIQREFYPVKLEFYRHRLSSQSVPLIGYDASSPANRVYCDAELGLVVSSPAVTNNVVSTQRAYPGRVGLNGWLNTKTVPDPTKSLSTEY